MARVECIPRWSEARVEVLGVGIEATRGVPAVWDSAVPLGTIDV